MRAAPPTGPVPSPAARLLLFVSLTQGSGQAAGSLERPTLQDTHQAPPRSPPPGSTHNKWSPAAGQASSQGEGRTPSSRPPISPREVQGRPLPLCPLDGEERSLLPPRTPCRKAGVSSAPVPSTPNPQGTSAPMASAAGGRGRSSLALGGGWETSALTPDPAGGGPHPVPGQPLPTLPSDRCRRETAVQRPASCAAAALGLAWLSVLGPSSLLRGVGDALSTPDPRSLSRQLPRGPHAGALPQKPAASLEFGASPDLWALCACQGGTGGQLGVHLNMSQVLPPRMWA